MINPWVIIGAITLAALVGWQGYRMGYSQAEDDHNAEKLALIEAGQKLESARIHAANQREAEARELEEQANADPVAVEQCFSPVRVRRLNTLR